jgi:transposase-like protein
MKIKQATVKDKIKYRFHKAGCPLEGLDPFYNPDRFQLRGKSDAGGKKYQCKECNKITTVRSVASRSSDLKSQKEDLGYNKLAKLIMNGKTVAQICRIMDFSPATYYHRLEETAIYLRSKRKEREDKHFTGRVTAPLYVAVEMLGYDNQDDDKNILISSDLLSGYIYQVSDCHDSKGERIDLIKEHISLTVEGKELGKWFFFVESREMEDVFSEVITRISSIAVGSVSGGVKYLDYVKKHINRTESKHSYLYMEIALYYYNFLHEISLFEGRKATPAQLMCI